MKITHKEKVILNEALQFYPYICALTHPPKEHKRYLCMAHVDKNAMCAAEHVCLYDFEMKRWLYNKKEVEVSCYIEIPEIIGINV